MTEAQPLETLSHSTASEEWVAPVVDIVTGNELPTDTEAELVADPLDAEVTVFRSVEDYQNIYAAICEQYDQSGISLLRKIMLLENMMQDASDDYARKLQTINTLLADRKISDHEAHEFRHTVRLELNRCHNLVSLNRNR